MLYPHDSACRESRPLDGIWDCRFDAAREGLEARWFDTPPADRREVAVPASVNEQFADRAAYLNMDWLWYFRTFTVPASWEGRRLFLRFGSANYRAEVFLNGRRLGDHEGGFMPFEFEVTGAVRRDADNLLAVRVDNLLDACTIPQGGLDPAVGGVAAWREHNLPDVHYDFFPYMGIQRPVVLYATGATRLERLRLTTTSLEPAGTGLALRLAFSGPAEEARVRVDELGFETAFPLEPAEGSGTGAAAERDLELPGVTPWSPEQPKLYRVTVQLLNGGQTADEYHLDFGFRTIRVEGDRVLLNGQPLFLRGFGRHEDTPVSGRGLNLPFMVKDYALMRWIGANSFRTSHYPYSEEMLALADRLGFVVVSEAAANTLSMKAVTDPAAKGRLLAEHCRQLTEQVERDHNFASVLFWSLGNECETFLEEGDDYFPKVVAHARSLDASRPVTIVLLPIPAAEERVAHLFDVLMLNNYPAWYTRCGRYEEIESILRPALEEFHAKYGKPILVSEFGADTMPGLHSPYGLMWTEEFQFEMIRRVIDVAESYPFVFGTHVWNLADFRVGQHTMRVVNNWKGVFTRDREPKMAAHLLRERWRAPWPR